MLPRRLVYVSRQTACCKDGIATRKPLPCVVDKVTRSTNPGMPAPETLEGSRAMAAYMSAARFSEGKWPAPSCPVSFPMRHPRRLAAGTP
jgi:hypothetical protein